MICLLNEDFMANLDPITLDTGTLLGRPVKTSPPPWPKPSSSG